MSTGAAGPRHSTARCRLHRVGQEVTPF